MAATFRIVLSTQVHENYGVHCWDGKGFCPSHWKAKRGNEYHLSVGEAQALGSDGWWPAEHQQAIYRERLDSLRVSLAS